MALANHLDPMAVAQWPAPVYVAAIRWQNEQAEEIRRIRGEQSNRKPGESPASSLARMRRKRAC